MDKESENEEGVNIEKGKEEGGTTKKRKRERQERVKSKA